VNGELDITSWQQTAGYKSSHCEAKVYGSHTLLAVDSFVRLRQGENIIVDLDQIVRQNNQAALESIMRGRKADEASLPAEDGHYRCCDMLKWAAAADRNYRLP